MGAVLRSDAAVDRLLVGICAAIWLAALGVSVAAAVVLADLGSGSGGVLGDEVDTPWLLYGVIGISALVIVGSIPLLLRARSGASQWPERPPSAAVVQRQARLENATEKMRAGSGPGGARSVRARGASPVPSSPPPEGASVEVVDRIVLRCTVLIVGAIGAGLAVVATATYLMGVDEDTAAWVALGVAGVITLAMPVIPFRYLGRLRDVTDTLGAGD